MDALAQLERPGCRTRVGPRFCEARHQPEMLVEQHEALIGQVAPDPERGRTGGEWVERDRVGLDRPDYRAARLRWPGRRSLCTLTDLALGGRLDGRRCRPWLKGRQRGGPRV